MKILILVIICIKMLNCHEDRRLITTLKYSRYYVRPLIVHGSPARQGDVPYLVSIKEPTKKLGPGITIWTNLCGGSIISKLKVLTAAHCFELDNYYYEKYPYLLRAVAGNLKTDVVHSGVTGTTENGQWRSITKVVIHWGFYFPMNDIALAFVDKAWEFSTNVDYILPASQTADYVTSSCRAAGFGSTDHSPIDSTSKVLLVAKIEPMSRIKCSFIWQLNMDNFVCTQSVFADVAKGDSGGPLVCAGTLDPKEEIGRDILVGIVSGKNFDKSTIFTRVSEYKQWIETDNGSRLKISCYVLAITLLILIYLLFHWFSSIVLIENENKGV